jgi:hypothetical protein
MPNSENELVSVPWLGDGPTFTGWFLTWTERLTWRERFRALNRWHFRAFFSGKRPACRLFQARKPSEYLTDWYRFGVTLKVE